MMTRITAILFTTLALVGVAAAQTTQATKPVDNDQLDFGAEGLIFPPPLIVNGHKPRTAKLLGEAYRKNEPLVWKRVQHVAELGLVALPETTPYLIDAMKDPSPAVRAEAARSAGNVKDPALLAELTKLLGDAEPAVRREAVLSAAALARAKELSTDAVSKGMGDKDQAVVAAAVQSAWTPADVKLIAQSFASLPASVQAEA